MAEDYVNLMADLKEDEVMELTKKRIDSGENPMNILDDSRAAMAIVGKRFADGEYFLPELVFSGELLKQVTEMVKPLLTQASEEKKHIQAHGRFGRPNRGFDDQVNAPGGWTPYAIGIGIPDFKGIIPGR